MATAQTKPDKENAGRLPAGMKGSALVKWRTLLKFLAPVIRAFHLSADGLDVMETDKGLHLRALGGGVPDHPFLVKSYHDGTEWKYKITPGTFDSKIPTLGGIPLTSEPVGTLGTGTRYIYLSVGYTHTVASSGYVISKGTLDSVEIANVGAVIPDPLGPAGGGYDILLATFENGVKTGQYVTTSLSGSICDSGGEDSTAYLSTEQT